MLDEQTAHIKRWASARRSQRVILRVPVLVHRHRQAEGDSFISEQTHTLVVNAHGALIALAMRAQPEDKLVLKNCVSGDEMQCHVVHVGEKKSDKAEVGIAFAHPAPHFWHIEFPPADWKPLPD